MAIHLKIVFVSCLLLLLLMEKDKPVLGKEQALSKTVKKYMENVEERLKALEECKACSKIKELNNTVNELKEEVNAKPASVVAGLEASAILKKDACYLKALGDFLKPVVQSGFRWKRCWQASQDGWRAFTFHSLCDDKGPTVTIIRVDHKYIFGGYTSLSWKQTTHSCDDLYDSAAFVYSLVNYPGWQPVKLNQTGQYSRSRQSIQTCGPFGPSFGYGMDIYITDDAVSYNSSYSNLGGTYGPPSGYRFQSSFARSFLAGSYYFQPDEVEVFYETM